MATTTAKKKALAPGSYGAQATKVYQSQSAKNLTAAGLSTATDVGIADINKVGAGTTEGVKKTTVAQQKAGVTVKDASGNVVKTTTGVQATPTATASDSISALARKQAQDDLKAGKITQAQYDTIQKQYLEGVKTMAGSRGVGQALAKADELTAGISGGVPEPSQPAEGETPEEKAARELADAQAQADYYKQQAEEQAKEQATVSGQVTDLSAKLQSFMDSNQEAIASLNASRASLGDRTAQIAQSVLNEGFTPNLNDPKTQAAIEGVWAQGGTADEMNQRVKQILMDSSKQTEPLTARVDIKPTVTTAQAVQTPEQEAQSQEMAFYQSPSMDFASLLDSLMGAGNDGTDFNSGDLALKQLQFSLGINSQAYGKLEKSYTERKNRITTQQDFYTDYWDNRRENGQDLLESIKDSQLRRNDLQEQQILAQKDQKMSELSKKTERYESFVKAQMASMGIPVEGQMGVTMLINSVSSWEDFVAGQELQYDEKISDLHNKSLEIIDNYALKTFEFNSGIDDKLLAKQDELSQQFEDNESDMTANENQILMANASSINGYFTNKIAQQAEQQKMAYEEYQTAQQRIWDVQVEGIKAQGGVVTIGADGMPTFLTENGQMVRSFDALKVYQSMNEIKFVQKDDWGNIIGIRADGSQVNYGATNPLGGTYAGGTTADYTGGGSQEFGGQSFNTDGTSKWWGDAECVGYSRFLAGGQLPPTGTNIDSKLATRNDIEGQAGYVQPGLGSTAYLHTVGYNNPDGSEIGHAAHVIGVSEDGSKITVLEANKDGKNTIQQNTYNVSEVAGFYTPPDLTNTYAYQNLMSGIERGGIQAENIYQEAARYGYIKPDDVKNYFMMKQKGVQLPINLKDVPATTVTDMGGMASTVRLANNIIEKSKAIQTGILEGRWKSVKGKFQFATDADQEAFNTLVADMTQVKAAYVKSLSGSQVGEKEFERLSKSLPDENDTPQMIRNKLTSLNDTLKIKMEETTRLYPQFEGLGYMDYFDQIDNAITSMERGGPSMNFATTNETSFVQQATDYINARKNEPLSQTIANLSQDQTSRNFLAQEMEKQFGKQWQILSLNDVNHDVLAQAIIDSKSKMTQAQPALEGAKAGAEDLKGKLSAYIAKNPNASMGSVIDQITDRKFKKTVIDKLNKKFPNGIPRDISKFSPEYIINQIL